MYSRWKPIHNLEQCEALLCTSCKWHGRRIIKGSPEPNAGGAKPHGCSTNHLMNTDDPSRKGIIHFLQALPLALNRKTKQKPGSFQKLPPETEKWPVRLCFSHIIERKYSGIHARGFFFMTDCGSSKQLLPEKKNVVYTFLEIQCKLIVAARSGIGMHSVHVCIEWMLFSLRTVVAKWTLPINYSIWVEGAVSAPVNMPIQRGKP